MLTTILVFLTSNIGIKYNTKLLHLSGLIIYIYNWVLYLPISDVLIHTVFRSRDNGEVSTLIIAILTLMLNNFNF